MQKFSRRRHRSDRRRLLHRAGGRSPSQDAAAECFALAWRLFLSRRGRGNGRGAAALASPLPRLGDSLEIGFHDLIELRFVLAFLKQNVGLNVIRRCLENARAIIGEERPFSTHRFRTDGKSIFLETLREVKESEGSSSVVDLKTNQLELVIEPTFRDLDLADGSVVQWRPFHGKPSIVVDPGRSFGKPLAADFGVPTSALANAAYAEGSTRRAAKLFEVPVAVVDDAIAFEQSLMAA